MPDSKRTLTIKFKPEGDKRLTKALKALASAQRQMELVTKKSSKALEKHRHRVDRNTVAVSKLQSAIGIYRNKMLLASFAVGIVTKAFVNFVRMAGVQETSVRKLADVFGNDGAEALDKYSSELQRLTAIGDETINNAMAVIGAYGASVEETKKLTKASLDLSAGLGLDLNTAALLVAKTIGSTTAALTRYGVGAGGATEHTEKVANIVDSVNSKFGGLAETLAQTTEGQLNAASAAFGDLGEELGRVFAPMVLSVAKALRTIAENLDAEKIRFWGTQVMFAAGALKIYNMHLMTAVGMSIRWNKLIKFASTGLFTAATAQKVWNAAIALGTKAMRIFNIVLKRNPIGMIAFALAAAIPIALKWMGVFEDSTKVLTKAEKEQKKLGEEIKRITKIQEDGVKSLEKKLALLNATNEEERIAIERGAPLSAREKELRAEIDFKNESLEELNGELTDKQIKGLRRLEDAQQEIWEKTQERTAEQKKADEEEAQRLLDLHELKLNLMSELRDVTLEFANERAEQARAEAEARLDIIGREEQQELESLRARQDYQTATDAEKIKREKKIIDDKNKLRQQERSAANQDIRKAFYVQQAAAIATIANETAKAVMVAIGTPPGTFTGGMPWSGIAVAMGAAQTAAVLAQKPPLMQYGGMVGGNRHSQGGTLIEAERGEFVINRNAVEAAGTEALNRINSGMSGVGGSSIVINNPILGKDAIEDEIIPQIQEALRRGGDIGL